MNVWGNFERILFDGTDFFCNEFVIFNFFIEKCRVIFVLYFSSILVIYGNVIWKLKGELEIKIVKVDKL